MSAFNLGLGGLLYACRSGSPLLDVPWPVNKSQQRKQNLDACLCSSPFRRGERFTAFVRLLPADEHVRRGPAFTPLESVRERSMLHPTFQLQSYSASAVRSRNSTTLMRNLPTTSGHRASDAEDDVD